MQASLRDPRAVDSNVKTILMSCLKGQQVIIKMEAMKIIHPEKFSELQASQPRYAPAPRRELPAEALATNPVQWSSDTDRSCYQTFRQYCGAACTCHIRNPLSSCTIM
ncbi:PREDICTED: RING finger protein 208 [Chaetura pelagica]|uniref:RING finger protein 208 n=1 Tax=Chaetura pelagica TaxID=8897 RepID=UPI000523189C|nr:PREDICTED: RING finger protein 208 [Chaetura pelagica]